jgi:hypothetical protein
MLAGRRRLDDQEVTVLRSRAGFPVPRGHGEETIRSKRGSTTRSATRRAAAMSARRSSSGSAIAPTGRRRRKLVGLSFQDGAVPHVPQGVTSDGRHAGRVTSAVYVSCRRPLDRPGDAPARFTEPARRSSSKTARPAVVAALPFVD